MPHRDRASRMAALGTGRRVLVVDDEPEMRYLTRAFLEHAFPGIEVVDAGDVRRGLAEIGRGGIDVVVSDYRMQGMDGFVFLQSAAKLMHPSRCILMTAYMDQTLRDRARDAGMRFIDKGGDPENVVRAVADVLRALAPEPAR